MLKSFMKTKKACMTGMAIGVVGVVTATFNFDPIQFVVSTILIGVELTLLIDIREEA
jgi:hypothetical protein|tara:strand:+ start:793 stop:963 length:171 start_codon:yes stop_codon:yes gene_type:complete